MASAKGVQAGKAFIRFGVNDKDVGKGLDRIERQLKHTGTAIKDVGVGLGKIAGVITGVFAAGVVAAAKFEAQMAEVSTVLGDDADQLGRLSDGIKKLSAATGQGTGPLAKGLYDILSASVPASKALDVLTVASEAAVAGLTDTGKAADLITTIINSYGESADKAGEISDKLFATIKRGKTTFPELAQSLGRVSSIAASANVSLDDLLGLIALLTRNGVKTEQAINGLGQAISNIIAPPKSVADEANKIGVNFDAASLKAEGLAGILNSLQGLDTETLSKLFPSQEALRAVLPAIKNLDQLQGDVAGLANSTGSTEEAYKKMADTLSFQFNRIKQSVVELLVSIGEPFIKDLKAVADVVIGLTKDITNFITENKTLVEVLGFTAAAALLTAGGLIAIGSAMTALPALISATIAGAEGLTTAFVALDAAVAANPIGLTIAAVAGVAALAGGVGYLIYNYIEAANAGKEYANEEERLLDVHKKQAAEDHKKLKRLQKLNKIQHKTSAEQKEQQTLIDELNDRYGNLNLVLDSTTGKVDGLREALEKLNESTKDQNDKDQKAVYDAAREGAEKYAKALEHLKKMRDKKEKEITTASDTPGMSPLGGPGLSEKEIYQNQIDVIDQKIKEARAKVKEFNETINQYDNKRFNADAGPNASAAANDVASVNEAIQGQNQSRLNEAKNLKDKLAKIAEEERQSRLSSLQKEIEDIKKHNDELKKLYKKQISNSQEQLFAERRKDNPDQDLINNLKEQIERDKTKRDAIPGQQKNQIDEARQNANDAEIKSEKQLQKRIADINHQNDLQIEKEKIKATKDGLDKKLALLKIQRREELREAKQTNAEIAQARADAVSKAKEQGLSPEQIKAIKKAYEGLGVDTKEINKKYDNRRDRAETEASASKYSYNSQGQFGASNVQALQGYSVDKYQERIAKATEQTADNTENNNNGPTFR